MKNHLETIKSIGATNIRVQEPRESIFDSEMKITYIEFDFKGFHYIYSSSSFGSYVLTFIDGNYERTLCQTIHFNKMEEIIRKLKVR